MLEISAGAITYTKINNQNYYLVILDSHGNYGFAKGHIEENETELDAAIREIKEEVNIDIKIDSNFRYELDYIMPNGINKKSIYYLGYYDDQTPIRQITEVEKILLLPYKQALDILTFDNMKQVLIEAEKYINKN